MKLSLNSELVNLRVNLTEGQIVGLVKAAIDMAAEKDGEESQEEPEEIVIEGFCPEVPAEAEEEEDPEKEEIPTPVSVPVPDEKESLEPEDFGALLAGSEPKKKEKGGWRNSLYMICPVCAAEKTFVVKSPLKGHYICQNGHRTALPEEARLAYFTCECGTWSEYHTNARSDVITIACRKCGMPVDLAWDGKKRRYRKM